MRCCEFGDLGTAALGKALKKQEMVQDLNLNSSYIGDVGAKSLAEWIRGSAQVRALWLRDNSIGAEGCEAIASALHENRSLLRLCLGLNTRPSFIQYF